MTKHPECPGSGAGNKHIVSGCEPRLNRLTEMLLYLINPSNPVVSILKLKQSRWNRYRVWKPLSLMVLAGLTPPEWEVEIIDENLSLPDYASMPLPDLVGITAFTSQANRAYQVADYFRGRGVPVVMGGIHATMCQAEASEQVDSVVAGEGESVWPRVLEDAAKGALQPRYAGGFAAEGEMQAARHDLLPHGYSFGAIQTTRGCPLNCNFCSVTAFNGAKYRQRPIPEVVREFRRIPENRILIVDDNLIGTNAKHIARAKTLFRALAEADTGKKWFAQATINFGDDEELLELAAKAGCRGVFIGFESPTPEGLRELGKKFNLLKNRDFAATVRRIQRHKIMVVGSFIIGLDIDQPGIGKRISTAATHYGVDLMNTLFLTPLPGTVLWERMKTEKRVALEKIPEDWNYFTLTYPVARYTNFSTDEIVREMFYCNSAFYSVPNIIVRTFRSMRQRRQPLINLVGNLSAWKNIRINLKAYQEYSRARRRGREAPMKHRNHFFLFLDRMEDRAARQPEKYPPEAKERN